MTPFPRAVLFASALLGLLVGPLAAGALGQPAAANLPDLQGTWLEVHTLPETRPFPVLGSVGSTSHAILLTEIRQTGTALTLDGRYCALEVALDVPIASTEIPEAFLCALGGRNRAAALRPTADGLVFELEWRAEVSGASLADPFNDPLPASSEDARVIDQDGDGHPGVTLGATVLGVISGEVYVIQRIRYRLVGQVTSPDRVEGRIEWTSEQVTLGATNPLLAASTGLLPSPRPETSAFVLVRLAPGTECDALRGSWRSLCKE